MILLKEIAERFGATTQEIAEADAFDAKTEAQVADELVHFVCTRAATIANITPPLRVVDTKTLAEARDYFYVNRDVHRMCDRAYALLAHMHCALTGADARGLACDPDVHRRLSAHCLADMRDKISFTEVLATATKRQDAPSR